MTWIIIVVFILIVTATWFVGLWNNVLTLINLLLATMIASGFYENLAVKIEASAGSYVYVTEFISLWVLFIVSFVFLRGLTEVLSWYRLRFDMVTDYIGRSIVSIWIGYVFVSFMTFSFHLAPLPPNAFQQRPSDRTMGFVSPDRQWMAFVQSRSRGALSESQSSTLFGSYSKEGHPDDEGKNLRVFDPQSSFILDHHLRRQQISANEALRVKN